jgi:hypothetical protein
VRALDARARQSPGSGLHDDDVCHGLCLTSDGGYAQSTAG